MGKGKLISFSFLACSIILASCGTGPIASDRAISRAQNAVEVAENYISGDLGGEDASGQMEEIKEELAYASEYTAEERSEDSQKNADYYLYADISFLETSIILDYGSRGDAESFEKVKECTDNLRDDIKKYK